MLRISGLVNDSIVDGPGLRLAVFTQGCFHNCEGCHNPQTHDINGGYDISVDEIIEKIKKNPLLDGITLSGGEPLLQANELVPLAKVAKDMNLSVIIYTGYTWEEVIQNTNWMELLQYTDILIDGKFEEDKRSLELKFKGSKNQRIIDVKKSLRKQEVVLYELDSDF